MFGDGSDGGIENYDASSQDIESQIQQNQLQLHDTQERYRQKVLQTVKTGGEQNWGQDRFKNTQSQPKPDYSNFKMSGKWV